jgi:oligopeptide transport system ATP-binding protein
MQTTPAHAPPEPRAGEAPALLEVDDLHVEFRTRRGVVNAVNGISYTVRDGQTLAIVGESGSGKSVGVRALLGIIDSPPGFITRGSLRFRGEELRTASENRLRQLRGDKIAMVFQDALSALTPVFPVGWQIAEVFRQHRGLSRRAALERAAALLDRVGIPSASKRVKDYPHQFSGGMRQRALIAMAIALDPQLLIADEPTTALDVTVQAQIMDLLASLREETGMGLILVTHDLGVVADVANEIAVMYAGRIVERGPVAQVYAKPRHPYTEGLLRSIPRLEQKGSRLTPIAGAPPNLIDLPPGCAFYPRCSYRRDRCRADTPPLLTIEPARATACHYAEEVGG